MTLTLFIIYSFLTMLEALTWWLIDDEEGGDDDDDEARKQLILQKGQD